MQPVVPSAARSRVTRRAGAGNQADLVRERVEFSDVDLRREQQRTDSAVQKLLRQRAQLAAWVAQQFAGRRVGLRQDDAVSLDCKYQGGVCTEGYPKLLLRGRQEFHQARMVALVQPCGAGQHPQVPQEANCRCLAAGNRGAGRSRNRTRAFPSLHGNRRWLDDRRFPMRWWFRVGHDFHFGDNPFSSKGLRTGEDCAATLWSDTALVVTSPAKTGPTLLPTLFMGLSQKDLITS